MLTDKGSIKTENISVERALDLYRKKLKIISLIMLIIGAVGLLAYIAAYSVLGVKYDREEPWLDVMLIFAVPFTLGLIGYITIIRLHKREAKDPHISECEFFADCFFCKNKALHGGTAYDKFNYSDAVLKRENEKYGYIFVFSKGLFLVFSKEDLTDEELNAIRKNFRKAIPDGEQSVELKKYEEGDKNELS